LVTKKISPGPKRTNFEKLQAPENKNIQNYKRTAFTTFQIPEFMETEAAPETCKSSPASTWLMFTVPEIPDRLPVEV
jgi:hypothetical protein